jgi:hypothetical protein
MLTLAAAFIVYRVIVRLRGRPAVLAADDSR